MSSVNTTHIDGDVSVGRNVAMGGNATVQGNATIADDLIVRGKVKADNIITNNKGIFKTLAALQAAYPNPKVGWFAGVGAGSPFDVYTVNSSGAWEASGGTMEFDVDLTDIEGDIAELQEDVENIQGNIRSSDLVLATGLLTSGFPAVMSGSINYNTGAWTGSQEACLIVPIINCSKIYVTYSEAVSNINRAFFKSFHAQTRTLTFSESESVVKSNAGSFTNVSYDIPDDAKYFYTSLNIDKIVSITIDGKEVFAETPAMRLLRSEFIIDSLSTQVIRSSDLVLATGVNLADKSNIADRLVSNNGTISESSMWKSIAIDISDIETGTSLKFGGFYLGRSGYYSFFGSGSKIESGIYSDPQGTTAPVTVTIPEGADTLYFDVYCNQYDTKPSGWSTAYDELICVIGDELPAYIPYQKKVVAIKGYPLIGQASSGANTVSGIVFDLPISANGGDIETGYAYINSSTGVITVKL